MVATLPASTFPIATNLLIIHPRQLMLLVQLLLMCHAIKAATPRSTTCCGFCSSYALCDSQVAVASKEPQNQ